MMNLSVEEILKKETFTREDLICLLKCNEQDRKKLFARSAEIKSIHVGKKVYYRGLVELSNICSKNCYYCGIRLDNKKVHRYFVTVDEDV